MEQNDLSALTFEHIVFLSNRDLWLLLAETDNVTILQACQKADDFLLFRIRSVFTKTACSYFNDDLIKFSTASDSEIRDARNRMTAILCTLNRRGLFQDWLFKFAN